MEKELFNALNLKNMTRVRFGLQARITLFIILSFVIITFVKEWFLIFAQKWTTNVVLLNLSSAAVSIFIASFAAFFIIKTYIKRPLGKLMEFGKKLGDNDLSQKVNINTNDEFNQLGEILNFTTDHMCALINEIQDTTRSTSENARDLTENSKKINIAAEHMMVSIQELAEGSNNQSQQIVNTSNYLKGVVDSIKDINKKLGILDQTADRAINSAVSGNTEVMENIQAMNNIQEYVKKVETAIYELEKSVQKINTILDVISTIADQTNLLALNAAIEAARAGEQGKGFAVVAEEVRKLAEQSREATVTIDDLLKIVSNNTSKVVGLMSDTDREVNKGTELSVKTKEAFARVIDDSRTSVNQTKELVALIKDIEKSSEQAGEAVQEISAILQQSAAGTEEVAANSEAQSKAISEIMEAVNELTERIENLSGITLQFKTN